MENSAFGRLPAELRNLIYDLVLYELNGAKIGSEPGLLRTCYAIRAEALLMFYYINGFVADFHEEHMNHDLCQWLKHKDGMRIRLIRNLTINCKMPSVDAKEPEPSPGDDGEEDSSGFLGFLQLMHLMESIRQASFERPLESVVRFTFNGADDAIPLDDIDRMSIDDQDKYRGAKFLIVCLVHGEGETMEAMEDVDSRHRLEELDIAIQLRRKIADAGTRS